MKILQMTAACKVRPPEHARIIFCPRASNGNLIPIASIHGGIMPMLQVTCLPNAEAITQQLITISCHWYVYFNTFVCWIVEWKLLTSYVGRQEFTLEVILVLINTVLLVMSWLVVGLLNIFTFVCAQNPKAKPFLHVRHPAYTSLHGVPEGPDAILFCKQTLYLTYILDFIRFKRSLAYVPWLFSARRLLHNQESFCLW